MSWFTGDDGKRYELFGAGGGQELADLLEVPLLGQVPLRPGAPGGRRRRRPIAAVDPGCEAGKAFAEIAEPHRRRAGAHPPRPQGAQADLRREDRCGRLDRLLGRRHANDLMSSARRRPFSVTSRPTMNRPTPLRRGAPWWTSASDSCTAHGARARASRRHRRRRPEGRRSTTALGDDDGVALAHRQEGQPGRHRRRQGHLREHRQRLATRAGSASAEPHRSAMTALPLDLLDRRLLFVTGKGGVGKTTVAAALGAARRRARQADAGRRGRRQGQPRRLLRGPGRRLRAPRGRPEPVRHDDAHRGVAQGVPAAPAQAPARRPPRPARPHLRLRRQRRARGQGGADRRQVPVGGPGAPLRPRRRRRRRHRSRRRPARRAAGASASW